MKKNLQKRERWSGNNCLMKGKKNSIVIKSDVL